ncbi:CDP-glucose 4,6-dehydratase [Aureimonas sp. AU12]|uniref:CDP-glucose 4,6-dehydratase n=1 Tax=Aureimonas sp. AU12 TaxID=1638161 RepID=UPI000781D115|nr:CDP-glucose 4,6-dehydratase [Aureimonas sp. AU12]
MDEVALSRALSGRRVLVTGHSGFKGGWLCLWLKRLGADVVGVSLPAPDRSLARAIGIDELVDGRHGDIRSAETFRAALGEDRDFDLVIHMAASAIVRTCHADPVDTYLTNVVGTAVVLDEARRMPSLKAAIVVTSDKCYENREWNWGYRETDPMGGRDPYSSSKGCAELVVAAYRSSYFADSAGPQIASVRAGNVIGGGDWAADRLVPDLIRSLEAGNPARIRNPASVRPWQHVLEPVRGYLTLAARLIEAGAPFAGGWNFGCDRDAAVDVGSLADLVMAEFGSEGPGFVFETGAGGPKESTLLRLDSTKAFVELGWRPLFDIETAVAATVAWYRAFHRRPEAIRDFTIRQIEDYAATWNASVVRLAPTPIRTRVPECA